MGIAPSLTGLISKMLKSPKLFPSGNKALTFVRSKGIAIRTQTFFKEWRTANNLIIAEKRLSKTPLNTMLRRSMIPKASGKLANNYLVFSDVTFFDRTSGELVTRTVSLYTNRLKTVKSLLADTREHFLLNTDNYNTTSDDILDFKFRSAVRNR